MTRDKRIRRLLNGWKSFLDEGRDSAENDDSVEIVLDVWRRGDDKTLEAAALFFGLDLTNQTESEFLLRLLAFLIFGEGKAGRPPRSKKWQGDELTSLAESYHSIKRENPRMSDVKIAEQIRRKHGYRNITNSAIRSN